MMTSVLTQGTTDLTAPEVATQIEQLGANIGAGAGSDFTNLYASSPANVFEQTMGLFAKVVRSPGFREEELQRQQQQSLDGLRLALSQPGSIAGMPRPRSTSAMVPMVA